MAFQEKPDEDVLWREFANRIVLLGGGIPGTLIVTTQRIAHRSVLPCWPFKQLDIDLGDVVSVARYNVLGVVLNGVIVNRYSGDSARFQVCAPARIVDVMTDAIQRFGGHSVPHDD